ncbi:enoyl-CoA hydratase EchA19-like [Acropora muricata]|uniref:enoyl-CoA hydratase EchA19-like n=1 Tax=Acropora muricata TaxID=159855 RepID=UPI0010FC8A16|nr:probable enoyl-CoA hydratase [Acropora millepora]
MAFAVLPRRARFAKISSLVALAKRFNSDLVETEQDGKIFHVVITRPEKRNAVNSETAKQLADAFRSFEVDEECNVAVFYGKGSNFCAGYDLEELSKRDPGTFLKSVPPVGEGDAPMGPSRLKLSKPVIGAIEGHAVAGGMELALMCDLRVAAEDSVMGIFNRRFGVPLLDGGTARLPYIVGLSRALDLIMTGRPVSATEAHSMGLVNRVVPKGKAVEEAIKLAQLISRFPSDSLIAERKAVFYAMFNAESFNDALTYEHTKGVKLGAIQDSIKGAREFLQGKGRKGSFDDYLD